MSVDPTLVISIDETGVVGATGPLVFSGRLDDDPELGITDFREPASEPIVVYADRATNQHGSIATEWSYPDILHAWSFVPRVANETELEVQTALIRAFLGRLRYAITITKADAPPATWSCKPGSLTPAESRTRLNITRSNPVWDITVPAHPIRTS